MLLNVQILKALLSADIGRKHSPALPLLTPNTGWVHHPCVCIESTSILYLVGAYKLKYPSNPVKFILHESHYDIVIGQISALCITTDRALFIAAD